MGYTNVKVFEAGYPGYQKYIAAHGDDAVLEAGKEEGAVDIAAFKKALSDHPASMMIIDVRDPDEFADGHFKTAVNLPLGTFDEKIPALPADKPIVLVCATGGRAGEAFYMIQDLRPALKNVYFLDAECTYHKDGSYQLKPPE